MSQKNERLLITSILLLAALLRMGGLGNVPPGLAHDEVANWLIARDILSGDFSIYFTAAYGHEPLYQYIQAATVGLFGDNWLGLRYPSVVVGLLGLAVTYILVRRLFGVPTALLTAGWLAVSFWPLSYARVAVRAISLPLIAALFGYFLARALDQRKRGHQRREAVVWRDWLLAGFFLGGSLYTYMAARILPVVAAALSIYFLVLSRFVRARWGKLLAMWATALVVAAPLVGWLVTHPGAEYRIAEVQQPLTRMLEGDPSLVWEGLIANLKSFTISGDPWPRQNIPGRPVFADVISATLFYVGLVLAAWRWRQPRYGALLIWLLGSLGPSVATADPPNSIRNILALVVVFVLPAQALVEAGHLLMRLSLTRKRACLRWVLYPMAAVPLVVTGVIAASDYFVYWPQDSVVRFDYQSDLTAVARQLEEVPDGVAITVAGLSVHTMDSPSLELSSQRDIHTVRICDTRETLVMASDTPAVLYVPDIVPFDEDLRQQLVGWGAVEEIGPQSAYRRYSIPSNVAVIDLIPNSGGTVRLENGISTRLPVSFGEILSLVGYRWIHVPSAGSDSARLLTYWQVESRPTNSLKAFAHLINNLDGAVAQGDGLASPAFTWQVND
ncbi:MAG: glycosyltransferase family 39 protein, partial [Anaerolineae bacterium]|nr:glycosyltransferase family 39 protein [Anaerolineae bacterium]